MDGIQETRMVNVKFGHIFWVHLLSCSTLGFYLDPCVEETGPHGFAKGVE